MAVSEFRFLTKTSVAGQEQLLDIEDKSYERQCNRLNVQRSINVRSYFIISSFIWMKTRRQTTFRR